MIVNETNNILYNDNYYSVMANEIIKGKQSMTLQEARLVRLIITQIAREDIYLKAYILNIKDFAKFLGISSNTLHRDALKICRNLRKREILIKGDNPKNPWKVFGWINSAEYDGNNSIIIKLSDDLKPYLLDLNAFFTKYKFRDILSMDSFYSLRFYELLKMHIGINYKYNNKVKKNFEFNLEYLREFFCCENKHKRISDFKKYVIDISLKEINEKSDLLVKSEYIKTGRAITSIRFFVEEKIETKYIEEQKEDVVAIEQPENFISDNQDMEQNQELTIDTNQNDIDIDNLVDKLRDIIKYPLKTTELKEILISANNNIDIIQAKYKLAVNRIKNKELDDKELKYWLVWAVKTDYKESEPDSPSITLTSDEELDDNADRLRAFIKEPLRIKDLKTILITANNDVELVKEKYDIAKTQGTIDNLTAWLISAIKGDYQKVGSNSKNKFCNYEMRDGSIYELYSHLDAYIINGVVTMTEEQKERFIAKDERYINIFNKMGRL